MNKYLITFKRNDGSQFDCAYAGESANRAAFNAANELGALGTIGLEVVKIAAVSTAPSPARTRLINWIETHDARVMRDFGDSIEVRSTACKDGVAFYEYQTIPATMAASRDLLGY
jgi:hypothetical protein